LYVGGAKSDMGSPCGLASSGVLLLGLGDLTPQKLLEDSARGGGDRAGERTVVIDLSESYVEEPVKGTHIGAAEGARRQGRLSENQAVPSIELAEQTPARAKKEESPMRGRRENTKGRT
jgi:hypothetical protein